MMGRRVDLMPWLPLAERHPPPSPRGIIILKDKILEKNLVVNTRSFPPLKINIGDQECPPEGCCDLAPAE
jgi:hypothetical protein